MAMAGGAASAEALRKRALAEAPSLSPKLEAVKELHALGVSRRPMFALLTFSSHSVCGMEIVCSLAGEAHRKSRKMSRSSLPTSQRDFAMNACMDFSGKMS